MTALLFIDLLTADLNVTTQREVIQVSLTEDGKSNLLAKIFWL